MSNVKYVSMDVHKAITVIVVLNGSPFGHAHSDRNDRDWFVNIHAHILEIFRRIVLEPVLLAAERPHAAVSALFCAKSIGYLMWMYIGSPSGANLIGIVPTHIQAIAVRQTLDFRCL